MEQFAAHRTASPHVFPTRTPSADAVHEHDALDWPPLSPETIRWMVVIGGGIFAASIGALLGGAMSL